MDNRIYNQVENIIVDFQEHPENYDYAVIGVILHLFEISILLDSSILLEEFLINHRNIKNLHYKRISSTYCEEFCYNLYYDEASKFLNQESDFYKIWFNIGLTGLKSRSQVKL